MGQTQSQLLWIPIAMCCQGCKKQLQSVLRKTCMQLEKEDKKTTIYKRSMRNSYCSAERCLRVQNCSKSFNDLPSEFFHFVSPLQFPPITTPPAVLGLPNSASFLNTRCLPRLTSTPDLISCSRFFFIVVADGL